MLEVDRQSGGFTPPAQLNVFDFLFNRGGMPLTIPMGPFGFIFNWGLTPIQGRQSLCTKPSV